MFGCENQANHLKIIPWILKYSIFRATQPWMAWLQGALGMRLGEFGNHALPEFSQGKSQGQATRFQEIFFENWHKKSLWDSLTNRG